SGHLNKRTVEKPPNDRVKTPSFSWRAFRRCTPHMSSVSLADLRDRGVALRPHEAVAIAQLLIHRPEASASVARPPYGPPTPETVEVAIDGSVVCTCSAATPAVSEIAIVLHALLPPETTRAPGGLRYAIGRALLEVE